MKKIIFCSILLIMGFGCSKQNQPTPLQWQKPLVGSPEYYENLRTYKNSDHAVYFGWYAPSADGDNSLLNGRIDALPDSLDIASIRVYSVTPGSAQDKAKKYAQTVKGMKFVIFIGSSTQSGGPGSGFGFSQIDFTDSVFNANYGNADDATLSVKLDSLAKVWSDTAYKYGMDGMDFDHEPNYCGCSNWGFTSDPHKMGLVMKAFGKYFGPKSGTGRILDMDGEIGNVEAGAYDYMNYGIAEAYGTGSPDDLQGRYNDAISAGLPTTKLIVTEDIQDYGNGGVSYSDPIHGSIPSVLGMAYWNPTQGRKGGAGLFLIEYDYLDAGKTIDYYYLRQSIQIMNPAAQ